MATDKKENLPSNSQSEQQTIIFKYLTFSTPLSEIRPCANCKDETIDNLHPTLPNLRAYDDPLMWSRTRKWILLILVCMANVITAYSAGCYEAAVDQMTAYFDIGNVVCYTGITIFTCGFALAPMILAPLSEMIGRRPVFMVTGVLFMICVLGCGATTSFGGMLAARFLAGSMGSVFSTIVAGVLADIYPIEKRNTPMTLFTTSVLFGSGLGPLVSGFIADNTNWRWVFYANGLEIAMLVIALLLVFRETRGSVILGRKARIINSWYDACKLGKSSSLIPERKRLSFLTAFATCKKLPVDSTASIARPSDATSVEPPLLRWKVLADEERSSLPILIKTSLTRPFHLLITEPVVFFFSLWISFAWAILYSTYGVLPYAYRRVHQFTLSEVGATFTPICVAAILSTFLSITQDRSLASRISAKGRPQGPEDRLYFACINSALLPIGLFWFGWTMNKEVHWIVPSLAIGAVTMGIFSIYVSVFNYQADVYGKYASSAIAAQSFCRNLAGGAFPLFSDRMFEKLGFGYGGTLLGGVAVLLTLVPWILVFFGPRIRASSKFAMHLEKF